MKVIFGLILTAVLVFGGYLLFQGLNPDRGESSATEKPAGSNVTIVDGKQIVEITAKGGYLPRISTVKADLPTILRFDTNGTFDCSSNVRIPSMNISQALPPSGKTDIALGILEKGMLQGTCGMGMYPFQIQVES